MLEQAPKVELRMKAETLLKRYAQGKRNFHKAHLYRVNLSGADLRNADLRDADLRDADLSRANLSGANLSEADLSRANLSEANLDGADLSKACLMRANLDRVNLGGANLSEACLSYANLNEANLSRVRLIGAVLLGINLNRIDLSGIFVRGASLSGICLSNANLSGFDLSGIDLSRANLGEADLSGANLSAANLGGADLSCANLSGANLSGVQLTGASLSGIDFNRIALSGVFVKGASLSGICLSNANLSGFDLSGIDLSRANLSGANLSGANLSGANLSGADLSEADLREADLCEADLRGGDYDAFHPFFLSPGFTHLREAKLNGANLERAYFDEMTWFPDGFNAIEAGACLIAPGTLAPIDQFISNSACEDFSVDLCSEVQEAIGCNSIKNSQELTVTQECVEVEGYFEPETIEDTRERVERSIVQRRGQSQFRQQLLEAYDRRCAITGFGAEQTLEAAHIYPYRGDDTHKAGNGLLLRGDLHTLFDLYLLTVHPKTKRVYLAPELRSTEYGELNSKRLNLPQDRSLWPYEESLAWHYKQCEWVNDKPNVSF
jgi:uncharacterized protein YjbI with pentapeptide repeats